MVNKAFLCLLVISVLMFLPQNAQAANEPGMYFCTSIDEGWNPVNSGDSFSGNAETGKATICVLVKLPYGVGCKKVKFEIYKGDKYSTTMTVDTKSSQRTFYKKITFPAGSYTVSVYDEYGNFLVQGCVDIIQEGSY